MAISWQWLFARSCGIPVARGGTVALFLTAWVIYLADRFGDSLSVDARGLLSLRQRFCLRHRAAWVFGLVGIALADLFVILAELDHGTIRSGVIVGACAVVYLVLNRGSPSLWQTLPLKELSIGFLFAGGTMVGLGAGLTSVALPGWLLFASLCSLNCVSIAVWERKLDLAQARISIASVFPCVRRALGPMLGMLLIAGGVLAGVASNGRIVFGCVAASAALLALLHYVGNAIQPDVRTALADFVLLTPFVALLS